jgi:hypothetical protein
MDPVLAVPSPPGEAGLLQPAKKAREPSTARKVKFSFLIEFATRVFLPCARQLSSTLETRQVSD